MLDIKDQMSQNSPLREASFIPEILNKTHTGKVMSGS